MGTLMPSTQSAPFSLVEKNDRIVCASARINGSIAVESA